MSPIAWPEAQRICDIPEVREALDSFAMDAHDENMLAMVSAIMGHAVTQGRAAGLEEERAAFEKWCKGEFPGLEVRVQNLLGTYTKTMTEWLYTGWQARATISPTPSEAGKDDARDAARYRWLKAWGKTDGFSDEAIDREIQIDAAVSYLEAKSTESKD